MRNGARRRTLALLALALALALLDSTGARADEGGVPFWFSGQYASLAAVPATPGWSLAMQAYYYDGDASRGKSFPRGDSVAVGLKSRLPLVLAQPTYAPETRVGGGQLAFGVGFGYGKNTTDADIASSPRGTEFNRSDTAWGFTDLYPAVSLAWSSGVHNWMTYLTGDIPIGAYDSKRLANIGLGHGAIDAGSAGLLRLRRLPGAVQDGRILVARPVHAQHREELPRRRREPVRLLVLARRARAGSTA